MNIVGMSEACKVLQTIQNRTGSNMFTQYKTLQFRTIPNQTASLAHAYDGKEQDNAIQNRR